jgi:hypothetical protein
MAAIRYNIIRLRVERPGQIVRFQHKIPSNLRRCTGFKAVHVRGVQTDLYIPEIGWFTASFNSLKEEAIVTPVSAQAFYNPEVSHEFQTLNVELKPSQLVVGVFVDTMKASAFMPYVVSLYLRCTESISAANGKPETEKVRTELVKNTQSKNQDCNCDDEDGQYEDDQDLEEDSEELNPDQLCSTI